MENLTCVLEIYVILFKGVIPAKVFPCICTTASCGAGRWHFDWFIACFAQNIVMGY